MIWLRKGLVHVFAAVLLIALLGGAFAVAFNRSFSEPDKIKTWLAESKVYDQVVANELTALQDSGQADSSVPLNNPQVQQLAEQVFTPDLVEKNVNTFIDANYTWLKGKTATPEFTIDLSDSKQSFAEKAGTLVKSRLASLPVCTPTQLTQLQIPVDPLLINCRPAALDPVVEGARVTQEITNSSFLRQPVITAANVNSLDPAEQQQSNEPYYQAASDAPKVYQVTTSLPLICGALALVCLATIILLAPIRRRGLRRIGYIFLTAGVLLIITKFISDTVVNRLQQSKPLGEAMTEQLQKPYTELIERVAASITHTQMLLGIGFILIASTIFIYLIATRERKNSTPPTKGALRNEPEYKTVPRPAQSLPTAGQSKPPISAGERPVNIKKPRPPRGPRLIQ